VVFDAFASNTRKASIDNMPAYHYNGSIATLDIIIQEGRMDVQKALQKLAGADSAKIGDIDAVILLDLSGEGGGKWTLKLSNGTVTLDEGETAPPNMTLSVSASDFAAMAQGELNPMAAFMQGKIKISGDVSLAMRLQSLLA